MSYIYGCPKCKAILNPDETIILVGTQKGRRLLIGLHPQPGNYQIFVPPGTEIPEGTLWNLLCPVCHRDLATEDHDNLCALDLYEDGARRRLLFSRVRGEKVTFVVSGKKLEETYGEHVPEYKPFLMNKEYFL